MDDLVDWYALGALFGLGVAAGVAVTGLRSRRVVSVVGLVLASGAAGVLATVAGLDFLLSVVATVAAAVVAALFLRRLSPEALPAALLAAAALALVPLAGYLLVLVAPLVGQRLARRAGARYAGLRVLARD